MANKIKSLVLIVILIISFALAGLGFYAFQKERAKNLSLQQESEQLKAQESIARTKLEESRKIILNLEGKVKDSQAQIDRLTAELDMERVAKQQAETQVLDLEQKLSAAQEDMRTIQEKLKTLESRKTELEVEVKDLGAQVKKVELGKIEVKPPAQEKEETKAITLPLEGKILVVNKDYNFAVINLGQKDGVSVDDVFSVYHQKQYVGEIKVMKVHEAMAAADFLSKEMKNEIVEDDQVVRKSK